jgi:hypothetical protein
MNTVPSTGDDARVAGTREGSNETTAADENPLLPREPVLATWQRPVAAKSHIEAGQTARSVNFEWRPINVVAVSLQSGYASRVSQRRLLIRPRTLRPDGTWITGGFAAACPLNRTLPFTDSPGLRIAGAFLLLKQPPESTNGKTRCTPRQIARHRE